MMINLDGTDCSGKETQTKLLVEKLLKEGRKEAADQHESDINHLRSAEAAYKEIAKYYDFTTIEC